MKKATLSVYLRYVQEVEGTPLLFEKRPPPWRRVDAPKEVNKEGA
jgi:hypothetical protein